MSKTAFVLMCSVAVVAFGSAPVRADDSGIHSAGAAEQPVRGKRAAAAASMSWDGSSSAKSSASASSGGSGGGGGVSEAHIAQIKSALNLKPSQERHWPAVASALRALSRAQSQGDDGMMQKASKRVASAAAIGRVAAAAGPLVRSLDADQKASAMSLAEGAGLGNIVAKYR